MRTPIPVSFSIRGDIDRFGLGCICGINRSCHIPKCFAENTIGSNSLVFAWSRATRNILNRKDGTSNCSGDIFFIANNFDSYRKIFFTFRYSSAGNSVFMKLRLISSRRNDFRFISATINRDSGKKSRTPSRKGSKTLSRRCSRRVLVGVDRSCRGR